MGRIPVGATIGRAYGFAFRNFLPILGIIWLPWLVMSAGGWLLQDRFMALSAGMEARDMGALRHAWSVILPFYLVMILLLFMQILGIAELALGVRGPGWFYVSLGRKFWRLIGAFLLLALAVIVGWLGVLAAAALLGFVLGLLAKAMPVLAPVNPWIAGVLLTALWCAGFYAWVRLSFLVLPVVAANEPGLALARGWALGRDNFWRILLVFLGALVPYMLVELAVVLGAVMRGMPRLPPHPTPEQAALFNAAMQAHNAALSAQIYHYWYLVFPLFGVFTALCYGTVVGAQCFAWRALTPSEPVA